MAFPTHMIRLSAVCLNTAHTFWRSIFDSSWQIITQVIAMLYINDLFRFDICSCCKLLKMNIWIFELVFVGHCHVGLMLHIFGLSLAQEVEQDVQYLKAWLFKSHSNWVCSRTRHWTHIASCGCCVVVNVICLALAVSRYPHSRHLLFHITIFLSSITSVDHSIEHSPSSSP